MAQAVFSSSLPKHFPSSPTIGDQAWNVFTTATGSNKLHEFLAPMINPALAKDPNKKEELDQLRQQLVSSEYKGELVKMKAGDGTLLEGVFFPGTSDRAILFALGSGGRYEAVANPQNAAHDFVKFFRENLGNSNILVINTRGIENSEGAPSMQGCALDYYTAWNYLESKNLKVVPWGHSLGYRYVVKAASWKQQENLDKKVSIVSDRGIDDIATEANAMQGGGVVGAAAGLAMGYAGWSGSSQEEWNSLKGKKLVLYAPDDKTVPYDASLFKKVNASDPNTTVIKLLGKDNAHKRIYTQEEGDQIATALNRMFV